MHLIVELFKNNLIKSHILINCFDELQQEVSNQNVDILAQMLMKLSDYMVAKSKTERLANKIPAAKARPGHQRIDLDYLETTLQKLFQQRFNKEIESRIRFKIQDLIEKYESEWKLEINESRKLAKLSEDPTVVTAKYVPKTVISEKKGQAASAKQNY